MTAAKRRVLLWEPGEPEGAVMDFRLTYEGPLYASGTDIRQEQARTPHKHQIRKHFHKQLKKLWYTNPNLLVRTRKRRNTVLNLEEEHSQLDVLANNWVEYGFRFAPLVHPGIGLNCRLEILMLRPSPPGGLLTGQSGDIDNRLKTLFDALQKPHGKTEFGDAVPEEGEDPFFVLLENDRLVTHVAVETDVLLSPVSVNEQVNDVRLVISCKVWPYAIRSDNLDLT